MKFKPKKYFFLIFISVSIFFLNFIIGLLLYFTFSLPSIDTLKNYDPSKVTFVYSEDYEVIGKFYNHERYVIPLDEIPELAIKAFIASEDSKFFEHGGIDFSGILRAAWKNLWAKGIKQGGSTITQQVAKTFLLTKERTYTRKIKELILANKIEKNFSKEHIIFLYINQIYFGHGAYGIGAASKIYFNKDVEDLTLGEITILAGLPRAPSKYSPYINPELAKNRQRYVLKRMLKEKYIINDQAIDAFTEGIKVHSKEDINLKYAPYFVEHIRKYVVEKYGNRMLLNEGLNIFSTVNLQMQKAATAAIKKGIKDLDKKIGYRGPEKILNDHELKEFTSKVQKEMEEDNETEPKLGKVYKAVVLKVDPKNNYAIVQIGNKIGKILRGDVLWARSPNPEDSFLWTKLENISDILSKGYLVLVKRIINKKQKGLFFTLEQEPVVQGALLSFDPQTNYVKAMVGGYDFSKNEFNRALQAKRQPGSAFKPIIYTAALDHGYTPATIIIDSPITYDDPSRDFSWRPTNYGEKFHGDITFRNSLVHSYNIPTIKIVKDIGIKYLVNYAKKLGINSHITPDLSISLGSSVLTLEELCTAFGVLAAMGKKVKPIFIKRITDRKGRILEDNTNNSPLMTNLSQTREFLKKTLIKELHRKKLREERTEYPMQPQRADSPGDIIGKYIIPEKSLSDDYAISPETAYLATHLMQGVVDYGTARRAREIGRPAAGKTGTTNDYIDAWFVGFTPNLVAGVWTGFDELKSMGKSESGAHAALPIWIDFMKEALTQLPVESFEVPGNSIVFAKIDPKTGMLADRLTARPVLEAFFKGTVPKKYSSREKNKIKSIDEFFFEDSY